jgi:hypothetical protein
VVGAQRQPWETKLNKEGQTLKGFANAEPFQGSNDDYGDLIPGLSLRSNRWAEISERLRR